MYVLPSAIEISLLYTLKMSKLSVECHVEHCGIYYWIGIGKTKGNYKIFLLYRLLLLLMHR